MNDCLPMMAPNRPPALREAFFYAAYLQRATLHAARYASTFKYYHLQYESMVLLNFLPNFIEWHCNHGEPGK